MIHTFGFLLVLTRIFSIFQNPFSFFVPPISVWPILADKTFLQVKKRHIDSGYERIESNCDCIIYKHLF